MASVQNNHNSTVVNIPTVTQHKNNPEKIGCVCMFCLSLLSFFCIALLNALYIIQIIFALYYPTNCSSFGLKVTNWLIIDGCGSIILFFNLVACIIFKKSAFACCLVFNQIILTILKLAWLVTGSILFWRDTQTCVPKEINTIMCISLIIGFLNIIGQQTAKDNFKS